MKSSLSIFALCLSTVTAARNVNCLNPEKSNAESVCRNECEKRGENVAFSVSEDDNWCRCYPKIDGLGSYTGNQKSGSTCFSMADEKTKILDYGACIIDSSSGGYGTKHTMKKCEEGETEDCIVEGRKNVERICQLECMKHDSVNFAISYEDGDDICRCYPRMESVEYTGSAKLDRDTKVRCFFMDGENIEKFAFGDCVPSEIYMTSRVSVVMKVCPRLRRNFSAY